jgi:DNA-binding transcriptional LysR family regulator
VERHGRPGCPEDIENHLVVAFDGEIANYAAARWLRSVAPRARIAARSDSWPALVATVKSGAGLAPLPIHHGDRDKELVRVIDTAPGLLSQIWLLVHPDMRQTPRVRAFFDYVVAELKPFRALLLREPEEASDQ